MNRRIGKGLPTNGSSVINLMLKFTGELATLRASNWENSSITVAYPTFDLNLTGSQRPARIDRL